MLYNEVSSSVERLLIKQQQKKISPEELAELDQLLKEHPEARAYADFYHNDPFQQLQPQDDAAVAAIWEDLEARMMRSRRKVVPLKKLMAAAAIILIISSTTYFIFKPTPKKETITASVNNTNIILRVAGGQEVNLTGNDQTITTGNTSVIAGAKQMDLQGTNGAAQGWNTIEIPQRLDYKLKLADGTEVTLNSSSKLKFPFAFTADKREVFIEGEAYFKIAKDTRHPFIVHTSKGDITVLGTEFNVNTYTANVLKTALVRGAVNVTSDKEVIVLKPGQELTLNGSKHILSELDERNTLSWMDGIQYFHNTPLSGIAAMIERWYGVPVKIEDSKLAAEPFTGIMDKTQSLDEFLTPMKGVVNMRCYYKGNVLYMAR